MNELNKELKQQASTLGLCSDWQKMWNNSWSKEKLIERMFKGIDFVLKHHWPANEFISKKFDRDILRKNGVFVDDTYSVTNTRNGLVLGKSNVIFRYNGSTYGNIHVRDNSQAKIIGKGRCFVLVHIYESAYVTAEQEDRAKIVLIKHSEKVTIVADKNVKIREEFDYLK